MTEILIKVVNTLKEVIYVIFMQFFGFFKTGK